MSRLHNLLLIGGGGHCITVLESVLESQAYKKIAIIDTNISVGDMLMGVPCIGNDDDLEELFEGEFDNAFISKGSIGNSYIREKLYCRLEQIGYCIPNIIDPTAVIGRHTELGKGIYIGKNAVVNALSKIGTGAIINTASIIEHQCKIGKFTHVAPGAVLCGSVEIGSHTHVGANATLKQGIVIGDHVMIGMGSVVLKNIGSNLEVYGNPCKIINTGMH